MEKVASIILIKDNKILLQLRDNKPGISYPGFWGLIGGHIDDNENPIDAIKREVMEEINYKIKGITFVSKLIHPENIHCHEHEIYLFKGNLDINLDQIKLTEGEKVQLFHYKELINLKLPEIIKNFLIENKNKFFN